MLQIDHVVMVVGDLEAAAGRLLASHGLASVPGGRHRTHGTANRIVPLGPNYLELMAVVDAGEAAGSPLGRWVIEQVASGDHLAALCVRTDDIGAVGRGLRENPEQMSRRRPDGIELTWRLVGLGAALAEGLPFFIEWEGPVDHHPGQTSADHRGEPSGILWVELGGDPHKLAARLGPHDLDLRIVPGRPGVRRVGIATSRGEMVL